MRKSLFIIAATALVVSCASNDIKNDVVNDIPIGFDSYSNLPTKSSSATTLESYHTTFGVWGYKTVNSTETAVMERSGKSYKVTYNDNGNGSADWDYDGDNAPEGQYLKYWDKTASKYQFDAYAPYSDNASISNHVISIASGQYAANENLQATLSETLNTSKFSGTGVTSTSASTDWMMPATYIRNASNGTMPSDVVNLEFKHILSKVILIVKTKDDFQFNITLKSLSLDNVIGTGSYNGSVWATSGSTAVSVAGKVGEITKSTTATKHKYYSIECLVMPQATAAPKFSVKYTIGDDPEEFNVEEVSIENIDSFAAGTVYIITATIGPDPIDFDCTVKDWTADETGEVTVD